jgi:hypothetical protein
LWQYQEDQLKFIKDQKRPVSARTIFKTNLGKRKELQELMEMVKKPTLITAFKDKQVSKLVISSSSVKIHSNPSN